MKRCVFINLPAATARRESVEASFAASRHAGWALERLEALGPHQVADLSGAIRPAEKACFASHRAAIGRGLDDDAPLLVVEDDTLFSPQAFEAVDRLLALPHDWELLFTDVAICDLSLIAHLSRQRERLVAANEAVAVNLSGRNWFGANAYVVRGPAKRRLHALISEPAALDRPYDLFLRDLAAAGRLKLGCAFPFVTRLSAHAEESQLQEEAAPLFDRTLNAWRRLMAVDRDLDAMAAEIRALSGAVATDESRLVGDIFGVIAAPAFPIER
jgi:GR25 family glycosyltransferase involved in LPS biosynthesis